MPADTGWKFKGGDTPYHVTRVQKSRFKARDCFLNSLDWEERRLYTSKVLEKHVHTDPTYVFNSDGDRFSTGTGAQRARQHFEWNTKYGQGL